MVIEIDAASSLLQDGTLLRFFTNKKVKYLWNNRVDAFEKLT